MFNTQIYLSTFICIVVLIFNMIFICIDLPKNKQQRIFYFRVLTLLFFGLSYNIVSGILPDSNIPINLLSQNIIAFSIGISSAAYFLYFLKNEYGIQLSINLEKTFLIIALGFVFFFVIPYTITDDLNLSRNLFLLLPSGILSASVFNEYKSCISKYKEGQNKLVKTHILIGMFSLLSLLSLPVTILLFGDNQLIEHLCYSFGFFIISIDYQLFFKRIVKNDIIYNLLLVEKLTQREREIYKIVIENPFLKYTEISCQLYISEKTISTHMSNIYKKLEVKDKKHLLDKYKKQG